MKPQGGDSSVRLRSSGPLSAIRALALLAGLLLALGAFAASLHGADEELQYIQRIDMVSLSHLDVGFTDQPSTVREFQPRYLDIAIDLCWETRARMPEERFHWTAESALPVSEWWQSAPPDRRERLVELIKGGQIDIGGFPFNVESFLDRLEWQQMLHWLPEDAWTQLRPRIGIQDDVTGLARAGAMQLLDNGIHRVFMGLNQGAGGAPFHAPTPFWWIMPDDRKVFVYLADGYYQAQALFGLWEWRRGPTPRAYELAYRPPRKGEIFASDEQSVRMMHSRAITMLRRLESQGYHYGRLIVAFSNVWRADDDPPFPYLPDFVATWRRLGLKPELRLSTVSDALEKLENEAGSAAPSFRGEWPDWWADGPPSGPRELAASRSAKRILAAIASPLWGDMTPHVSSTIEALRRDLCLFEEHTWGSAWSEAFPYQFDSDAQKTEKVILAYRAKERSEWLLSQRARTLLYPQAEGLYVANTTASPFAGWVAFPSLGLRDDYHSVRDRTTGSVSTLEFRPGIQMEPPKSPSELTPENPSAVYADNEPNAVARFWVENVPPNSVRAFTLEKQASAAPESPRATFTATLDAGGWPSSLRWPGMKKPLYTAGTGEVTSVKIQGFAPRWTAIDILGKTDRHAIDEMRRQHLVSAASQVTEQTMVERSPHITAYTQHMKLPGMKWLIRRLKVWNDAPRARLTIRLNRISSTDPEILFVSFSLPTAGTLPTVSNGGVPFVPYEDQLPGSCRDYFAIDGWASYSTSDGNWLWVSRDAPLVTFGDTHVLEKLTGTPADTNRILSIVFNNVWFTNYYADSPGELEFQYDLVWNERKYNDPAALAGSLETDPVVLINPAQREHPVIMDDLFRP
jgi:hypothetical protein